MLARHAGEDAIGVDNWAALVIEGDSYRLVSRAGYPGSVSADGSFSANRTGTPGVWRLRLNATTGALQRTLAPPEGAVAALLTPPRFVVQDSQLAVARGQNPDDGVPAAGTGDDEGADDVDDACWHRRADWWWS